MFPLKNCLVSSCSVASSKMYTATSRSTGTSDAIHCVMLLSSSPSKCSEMARRRVQSARFLRNDIDRLAVNRVMTSRHAYLHSGDIRSISDSSKILRRNRTADSAANSSAGKAMPWSKFIVKVLGSVYNILFMVFSALLRSSGDADRMDLRRFS